MNRYLFKPTLGIKVFYKGKIMNVIIKQTTIGNEQVNAVNARDLHAELENKYHFSDWIKSRIEKYGFIEGIDYISKSEISDHSPAVVSKEYYISLDMAKELSMVQNNDKGRQARKYFIEVEKQSKAKPKVLTMLDYAHALIESQGKLDEAIKTKAYISDKKTASAMGTASAAVKKAKKLQEELREVTYGQLEYKEWKRKFLK